MGVSLPRDDFVRFYEAARDDCLRTVYASTRDFPLAEDLVAEAFARAWARWRRVSSHPAPRAWIAIPQGALLWLGLAQTGAPAGSSGPAGPMSVGLFDDTAACAASG
jgi:hypothetical protein